MGGSPCKAWDWRNPIVQTLFTQGATRTAVLRARRDSRTNGRGCPSASARGGAVVPPGPGGRGPGLFRLWTAIYQRPASDPVGREGGGKTAQAGQKRQRPEGGGGSCPGRAEAPTSRGGTAGGRSPPGGGLWPRPCSALRAERRPPPPGTLAYRALSLAPSLVSSTP